MSDDAPQRPPDEPAGGATSDGAGGRSAAGGRSDAGGRNHADREDAGGAVGAALAQAVAEHHAAVYRYAYRLCGSAADAEDVVQQTFLIAHEKLDQVRDGDRVGHWLLVVARNVFLKMRRRRTPMPAGGLEIDVNSVPDRASLADDRTEVDPIDPQRLQASIDELPDEFRIPLLMFYFEEASYREIAEQLDLPPGTVMSRLSRAKSHLRKKLLSSESPAAGRSDNGHNGPAPSERSAKPRKAF